MLYGSTDRVRKFAQVCCVASCGIDAGKIKALKIMVGSAITLKSTHVPLNSSLRVPTVIGAGCLALSASSLDVLRPITTPESMNIPVTARRADCIDET